MSASSLNNSSSEVTIESTLQALMHWRKNKQDKTLYPEAGIPTNIWIMFFALEDKGYSGSDIRRLFSLNSEQYKKRRQSLKDDTRNAKTGANETTTEPPSVKFCEAKVKPGHSAPEIASLNKATENRQAVKQLKSTSDNPSDYLDFTTVIIECIRPDGHRLKIHASNQSIDIIMKTFYHELGAIKC